MAFWISVSIRIPEVPALSANSNDCRSTIEGQKLQKPKPLLQDQGQLYLGVFALRTLAGNGIPPHTTASGIWHSHRRCQRVGILRLRSCFASRSGYSAQDDISPERWAQPPLYIRLLLRFSSSGDGFAGFLVGGAAALGFALVPHLFALGER